MSDEVEAARLAKIDAMNEQQRHRYGTPEWAEANRRHHAANRRHSELAGEQARAEFDAQVSTTLKNWWRPKR